MLNVVCISDTHNLHESVGYIPDCDVLIHAGDFTVSGKKSEVGSFLRWFSGLPHKHKILIAGNHDVTLDKPHYETHWELFHSGKKGFKQDVDEIREMVLKCPGIHYLEHEAIEIEGYVFFGSPYSLSTPKSWGFQLENDTITEKVWGSIPDSVDVLITHSPSYGVLDEYMGNNLGCKRLYSEIVHRIKPQVHVHGHIHSGSGMVLVKPNYGHTTSGGDQDQVQDREEEFTYLAVNASVLDEKDRLINPPRPFSLELPKH